MSEGLTKNSDCDHPIAIISVTTLTARMPSLLNYGEIFVETQVRRGDRGQSESIVYILVVQLYTRDIASQYMVDQLLIHRFFQTHTPATPDGLPVAIIVTPHAITPALMPASVRNGKMATSSIFG